MSEALSPIVAYEADGTVVLKSPMVGVWSQAPASGMLLGPGSLLGILTQLGKTLALRVPGGVAGRIAPMARRDLAVPVGYGEVLVRVEPAFAAGAPGVEDRGAASAAPAGGRHVVSPTDGVFYGSPGPGAAPFVAPALRALSKSHRLPTRHWATANHA
jgi:hypothetical protein